MKALDVLETDKGPWDKSVLDQVTIPHPNVTHTFLITGFNYLTGKWEGISNPEKETLFRARLKRGELENKFRQEKRWQTRRCSG